MEKEKDQQREVLFPVRLDESVMQASQAWAKQLRRTRHIGDFTRWTDPEEYQRAFGGCCMISRQMQRRTTAIIELSKMGNEETETKVLIVFLWTNGIW